MSQPQSAVMLFAPQCAAQPLQHGEVMWGGEPSEPLPVVDKYKYLGVMHEPIIHHLDMHWHALLHVPACAHAVLAGVCCAAEYSDWKG